GARFVHRRTLLCTLRLLARVSPQRSHPLICRGSSGIGPGSLSSPLSQSRPPASTMWFQSWSNIFCPILCCGCVVDDYTRIAIGSDTFARPILTADHNDGRIDHNS